MNIKKNVLMIGSSTSTKGGMTTVVEGLLDNNFDNTNIYYVPTHIEGYRFKQLVFFTISIIKIIYYLIFRKIKIVHIHLSERGSFIRKNIVCKIAKLFRKKVIVHMHGAEFKEFYNESSAKNKKKIVKFLKESDKVIVLGESWYEFVKNLDKQIKVEIMPNFVKCTKEKVDLKNKEINILFLSVLIRRKGIYDLLEAIKILIDSKELNEYKIKVIIAGTGKEEKDIKNRVEELGINKYFEFTGWVNNKQKEDLFKKSQIFVLPSYNEGLPVAILEAMSYGLPVISTNVGSIEDAIKNNYNGIIINPGNINQLKESIIYLVRNKEKWYEFSKNSKEMVDKIYSKDKYLKRLETLYTLL